MFFPFKIIETFCLTEKRQDGNIFNGLFLACELSVENWNKWGFLLMCLKTSSLHLHSASELTGSPMNVSSNMSQRPEEDGRAQYVFWLGRTAMTQYFLLKGRMNHVTLLGSWDVGSLSSCLRVGFENLPTQMYCQVSWHLPSEMSLLDWQLVCFPLVSLCFFFSDSLREGNQIHQNN